MPLVLPAGQYPLCFRLDSIRTFLKKNLKLLLVNYVWTRKGRNKIISEMLREAGAGQMQYDCYRYPDAKIRYSGRLSVWLPIQSWLSLANWLIYSGLGKKKRSQKVLLRPPKSSTVRACYRLLLDRRSSFLGLPPERFRLPDPPPEPPFRADIGRFERLLPSSSRFTRILLPSTSTPSNFRLKPWSWPLSTSK